MGRRKATLVWLLCGAVVFFAAPGALADDGASTEPPTTSDGAAVDDAAVADHGAMSMEEGIEEDPPVVREIVFPVVGDVSYSQGFGDCRDGCTRLHAGIDILTSGWKGVPVVASHDGTVTATKLRGELSGCSVTVEAADGWTTRYVHLNTDVPGTDEAGDLCFAPGIEPGAVVPAGTLLGWVGDTGNAEETTPHLHFEIRDPDGEPVDPWLSLEAAIRIAHRWITPRALPSVMVGLFPGPQAMVHVIDVAHLEAHLFASPDAIVLDAPLVPFDATDPEPAILALEALEPERIVVLTPGEDPSYLDYLRTLAPIVATSDTTLDTVPAEGTATPGPADAVPPPTTESETSAADGVAPDAIEVVAMHAPVASRHLVVVEALGSDADEALPWLVADITGHTPVVVAGGDTSEDIGASARELPGSDANRDGFWWMTADGWRFTDTLDEAPSPGIALVDGRKRAATVAYLVSSARAPQTPLWHHQPTSRATKSL